MKKILRKIKNGARDLAFPAVSASYVVKKPLRIFNGVSDRSIKLLLVSLAYNSAELVAFQYKYLKTNLKDDFLYVVADHSYNMDASGKMEKFCRENRIPYYRLPEQSFFLYRINASIMHALALNWAYRNIVLTSEPAVFGFLDNDIFPVRPASVLEKISGKMIYGYIRDEKNGWYLWPGLAVFNASRLREKKKEKKLNFLPWKEIDTGGRNYKNIYKYLDRSADTRPAGIAVVYIDVKSGDGSVVSSGFAQFDEWLHISGASDLPKRRGINMSLNELLSLLDARFGY